MKHYPMKYPFAICHTYNHSNLNWSLIHFTYIGFNISINKEYYKVFAIYSLQIINSEYVLSKFTMWTSLISSIHQFLISSLLITSHLYCQVSFQLAQHVLLHSRHHILQFPSTCKVNTGTIHTLTRISECDSLHIKNYTIKWNSKHHKNSSQ